MSLICIRSWCYQHSNKGVIASSWILGILCFTLLLDSRKWNYHPRIAIRTSVRSIAASCMNVIPVSFREIFKAALGGVGMLGVFSQITLQCVPAFTLHRVEHQIMSVDRLLQDLDTYIAQNEYMYWYWFPYTDLARLVTANTILSEGAMQRHTAPGATQSIKQWFDEQFVPRVLSLILRVASSFPSLTPHINAFLANNFQPQREAVGGDELLLIHSPVGYSTNLDFYVPISKTRAAFEDLRRAVQAAAEVNYNYVVAVRYVTPEEIWLSPSYNCNCR